MHRSNILNHHGEERENYYNAVSPPILQTSNFAFPNLNAFRAAFSSEFEHSIYTRGNNPTVTILRKKLAALEGTEDALVCSSGSAAIAAAVISQVNAGDHVVCIKSPYNWTFQLLDAFLSRFGVTTTFVDGQNSEEVEAAIQDNTTVLYLESPNSLTFELQNIRACAALAKKHGLVSIIDNSYCSPIFQQPHKLGIDIMVHSGTKYLNGHSDVVVGVICGSREHIQNIFEREYMTLGPAISPNDAFLVLRGLRTLELRLKQSDSSAKLIAQRLTDHPKVNEVRHPLLPSFPQYELAQQQMSGAGGLFSVYFNAPSMEKMETFVNKLIDSSKGQNRFILAVSWGSYESLILPVVGFYDVPNRENTPKPWNLIRFYIGLEDPEWLWEGLEEAMKEL